VWQVHEQASIALLEMGDTKAAIPLIKAVLLQFPENSIRARCLQVGHPVQHACPALTGL
jgi:hypothetical protein